MKNKSVSAYITLWEDVIHDDHEDHGTFHKLSASCNISGRQVTVEYNRSPGGGGFMNVLWYDACFHNGDRNTN